MTQAFNWQFKLMINRFNFKVAFTAMMFISVASTVYNVLKYHNIDRTSGIDSSFAYIFNQSNELLPLIIIFMPVIAVLPFSTIHTSNRSLHSSPLYFSRFGISKYYISQALCSFAGSFTVTLLPLLTNITLNNIFFQSTKYDGWNTYFSALTQISPKLLSEQTNYPYTITFAKLFFEHPIMYTVLFAVALSLFIGLCGVLSYSISLGIERFAILSALPMEIFVFLGLQQSNGAVLSYNHNFVNLNIMNYFTVNSLMGKNYFIVLAFCALMLAVSVALIYCKIKRNQFD